MKFRIKKKIAKRNVLEGKSQASFWSYRPKDKIYKILWEFHKGDDDPSPSVPHGHSLDRKYKLSIWDGSVYKVSDGERIGVASKRELLNLYKDKRFQQFVFETREWYTENHPFCPPLAPLNNAVAAQRATIFKVYRKNQDTPQKFVCEISVKIKRPV